MAHKTLIDGTAYDISGGKAMVSGTGYDIASGRTLVGGTGYEIPFGGPMPVTIVGGKLPNTPDNSDSAFVEYGGKKYVRTTIEVQAGESVKVVLRSPSPAQIVKEQITLNGTVVSSGSGRITYTHTVRKRTTITFTSQNFYYTADIAET